jgi:two-component sensor histidine kinase
VIDDGVIQKWVGVCIDIEDRKQADEHLRLMVHELNHRVKNNLSTVQAIAAQTLRDSKTFEEAKTDFTARVTALAARHDVLTQESWEGATLAELIGAVLEPHCSAAGLTRWTATGPAVFTDTKTALALSMALHELGTNAAKYGAFSDGQGRVAVRWTVENGRLNLLWTESHGPPVTPPESRGFGSRLIERGLAAELRGEVRLRFEPQGVTCTIDVPLPGGAGDAR